MKVRNMMKNIISEECQPFVESQRIEMKKWNADDSNYFSPESDLNEIDEYDTHDEIKHVHLRQISSTCLKIEWFRKL
jgi:hypothetical protein